MGTDQVGGITGFLRRFKLTLGIDDFSPPLALGFCLLCQRALHFLRQIDIFDLYIGNFNSPRLGLLINDPL